MGIQRRLLGRAISQDSHRVNGLSRQEGTTVQRLGTSSVRKGVPIQGHYEGYPASSFHRWHRLRTPRCESRIKTFLIETLLLSPRRGTTLGVTAARNISCGGVKLRSFEPRATSTLACRRDCALTLHDRKPGRECQQSPRYDYTVDLSLTRDYQEHLPAT